MVGSFPFTLASNSFVEASKFTLVSVDPELSYTTSNALAPFCLSHDDPFHLYTPFNFVGVDIE